MKLKTKKLIIMRLMNNMTRVLISFSALIFFSFNVFAQVLGDCQHGIHGISRRMRFHASSFRMGDSRCSVGGGTSVGTVGFSTVVFLLLQVCAASSRQ